MATTTLETRDTARPTVAEPTRPTRTFAPAANVTETATAFTLTVDMPGVDGNSLDIQLDRDLLSIRGPATFEASVGHSPIYAEFDTGVFARTFRVGDDIDREAVQATMRDGVLELRLPKAKPAGNTAQRIAVKAE